MQKSKLLTFASAICQTAIQIEENVTAYQNQGHIFCRTEAQFKEEYPEVDPNCIFYVMQDCFYFNKETLAACAFYNAEVIPLAEAEVAQGRYINAIFGLPDAVRFDYLAFLAKRGIPDLYDIFFCAYTMTDYGFNNIDDEIFQTVVNSKTAKHKAKTRQKLKKLPDVVTIYRGGNTLSTPYQNARSWTLDIGVAIFFARRRGESSGYIVKAEIDKADIIEVFPAEKEVIVDPRNVRSAEVMDLSFMDEK